MRRGAISLLALVGCAYSEPTVGDDMPPPPPGGGNPDGGSNPARTCPNDPSLKLCVDFDGSLTPTVADGANHTIASMNVIAMTRAGDHAAHLDASSQLYIASAAATDLDLPALTLVQWIAPDQRPSSSNTFSIFDHSGRFSMEMKDDGSVTCSAGSQSVSSHASVSTGSWTQVACTSDSQGLTVYVAGAVEGCQNQSGGGSISGPASVAIGAQVSSGPTFSHQFLGGIDNVWLYDHVLASSNLCTLAGKNGCNTNCPSGE